MRPIRVAKVVAPSMFATVGFESIYADIVQKVSALGKPPLARLRRGEVGQQSPREPPPPIAIRPPTCLPHGVTLRDHHVSVVHRLAACGRPGFQERDLPEQHLDPELM